jgi:hypothetical protein
MLLAQKVEQDLTSRHSWSILVLPTNIPVPRKAAHSRRLREKVKLWMLTTAF